MYQSFINQIPVICLQQGVGDVVVSPGSRSAPLTLAFARFGKFNIRVVVDERSAAFIALGLAQQTRKPVILICTSGTAALNYFPAIAEAYFQKIPLLVLTADRPFELIGKQDGQTIFQQGVYGKHVKASFQLPDSYSENNPEHTLHQAFHQCLFPDFGPVHINIPLREPLYEKSDFVFPPLPHVPVAASPVNPVNYAALASAFQGKKILVISAALPPQPEQKEKTKQLIDTKKLVWLADINSNLRAENTMASYDALLSGATHETKEKLRPEVLLSIGDNHVSKNLKTFLKNYPPAQHIHFTPSAQAPDTFGSLTTHVQSDTVGLIQLLEQIEISATQEIFLGHWDSCNRQASEQLNSLLDAAPFCEFTAIRQILQQLQEPGILQLANSMAVRYANYLGAPQMQRVFCNRGTSGIDGSVSTAVGAALTTKDPVVLLTGDLSFFYDEHGLWNNFVPPNLRIIVLNNNGGGIFRMIDGPSDLPERETYFATPTSRSIQQTALQYGLHYFKASNAWSVQGIMAQLYHPSHKAIIAEIVTDPLTDQQVFQQFKKLLFA